MKTTRKTIVYRRNWRKGPSLIPVWSHQFKGGLQFSSIILEAITMYSKMMLSKQNNRTSFYFNFRELWRHLLMISSNSKHGCVVSGGMLRELHSSNGTVDIRATLRCTSWMRAEIQKTPCIIWIGSHSTGHGIAVRWSQEGKAASTITAQLSV